MTPVTFKQWQKLQNPAALPHNWNTSCSLQNIHSSVGYNVHLQVWS